MSILGLKSPEHLQHTYLERIAVALEEANRIQRVMLGLPDPGSELLTEDLSEVSFASDALSYENELEDRRTQPR